MRTRRPSSSASAGCRAAAVQALEELTGRPLGTEHLQRRMPPVLRNDCKLSFAL